MYIERPYVTVTDIMRRDSQAIICYFCLRALIDDSGEIIDVINNSVFFTFWDLNLEFACLSSSKIITEKFLEIYKSNIFESAIEKIEQPLSYSNQVYRGGYIFVKTEGNLVADFVKRGRKYDVELNVIEI
jgi:hypothetical protein